MTLSMREAMGMRDTYTLSGQNVYVSCSRRIRFTLETYTFSSPNVYVLPAIGIRCTQQGYTFCPAPLPSALSDGSTSSLLRAFRTRNRR